MLAVHPKNIYKMCHIGIAIFHKSFLFKFCSAVPLSLNWQCQEIFCVFPPWIQPTWVPDKQAKMVSRRYLN